ncbi:hypothetical protein Ancab_020364 [Ancistrocladus abbreviatus]
MSKSNTFRFRIENRDVKTTVIPTESDLNATLEAFLTKIGNDRQKRVVALDIEKVYKSSGNGGRIDEKVSVLKLCTGCFCLVIQLLHFRSIPPSLAAFLQLPDISFVGVGIKHCVDCLERDYGIKCRNAVDLGQLASHVREERHISAFGLVDLAYKVASFDLSVKAPDVAFSDWGAEKLSTKQVRAATSDAFVAFFIGHRLLGGFLP